MATHLNMAKKGASTFYHLFENKYTVILLAICAILTVFVPLAVVPPDDDADHAKDLDKAKTQLKAARKQRMIVIVASCFLVIAPMCLKGFMDFHDADD